RPSSRRYRSARETSRPAVSRIATDNRPRSYSSWPRAPDWFMIAVLAKGRRRIEMALHPQCQDFLDRMNVHIDPDGPPLSEVPPSELRGFVPLIVGVWADMGAKAEPVAAVEDREVPGPAGPIPVRVYTPEGEAPFPCLVWFHGGGWVIGDLDFV